MKKVIATYVLSMGILILIAALYTDNLSVVKEVLDNFKPILL